MEKTKLKCNSCGKECGQENIIFDDKGYGYSTKLLVCPNCKKIQILKYYKDKMDINHDNRYYG